MWGLVDHGKEFEFYSNGKLLKGFKQKNEILCYVSGRSSLVTWRMG